MKKLLSLSIVASSFLLADTDLEQLKAYDESSKIFNKLYEKSDKKEYMYRSLHNDLTANKSERLIDRVDKLVESGFDDYKLMRLKVIALIKLGRHEEAITLALELVESSKAIDDYLLVSEIYIKDKNFDTALKYLESAYVKEYNEKLLDKM